MIKKTIRLSAVLAVAVAVTLAALLPQAQAQKKMYRCGSNYQDHPCDGPAGASHVVGGETPAAPTPQATADSAAQKRAAYQKQLRCENYGRQMDELRVTQKAMKQPDLMEPQVRSLQARMKGDSC